MRKSGTITITLHKPAILPIISNNCLRTEQKIVPTIKFSVDIRVRSGVTKIEKYFIIKS